MSVEGLHNIVKQFSKLYRFVGNISSIPQEMENQDFPVEAVNGLFLFNDFLPEEIVANVLSFASWNDLLSCRLVCHSWRRLIDSFVGLDKLKRDYKHVLKASFISPVIKLKTDNVPFYLCFAISRNVFGKNHLKNSFGEAVDHHCRRVHPSDYWGAFYRSRRSPIFKNCSDDCPKFKHWIVTKSGGDGWIVEEVPVGSQPLPGQLSVRSCFVTSFGRCHKEQCVNLRECGLNNKIMDEVQPHIEVSDWYAKRFDCGIIYILRVSLLDNEKEIVDHFSEQVEERQGDDEWHQVSHTFKDYGPGVRFVLFEHEGRDTQFWAGHYGSKMAGGSVVARIPISPLEEGADETL